VSSAQEWLKETVEEYTTRRGNGISACLIPLFCDPLAAVSFDRPTEVTVPLLSEYITHLVTVQEQSSSLVGVTYSAFKRHFTSQYVAPFGHCFDHGWLMQFHVNRGKSGHWKPSPIPDECEGNPCEAQVIHDLVNAIKNKHKVEGRVRNHARAIRIEDIKKLQGVTASRVLAVLFQWALTTVNSLDVTQRDAVHDHLMFCAISSLGWALWTWYGYSPIALLRISDCCPAMKSSPVSRSNIWIGITKRHTTTCHTYRLHLRSTRVGRSGLTQVAQGMQPMVSGHYFDAQLTT